MRGTLERKGEGIEGGEKKGGREERRRKEGGEEGGEERREERSTMTLGVDNTMTLVTFFEKKLKNF